ncbi:RluA family pseudouridine synthase [Fervidobacterium sp.]
MRNEVKNNKSLVKADKQLWLVDNNNYFSRVDKFLRNVLKNVPLSAIYKLFRTGKVYVNDKRVKEPSMKLEIGDRVEIKNEDISKYNREFKELRSAKMKLDIIFEDDELIVVNKPAGISVHPGKNVNKPSIIEGLKYYGEKTGFEPFLVHRLDKETSGVLIVAKNRQTARELSEMISSRNVEKRYVTMVFGRAERQEINVPIDSQEARTIIKPLKVFRTKIGGEWVELTLLDVEIETGRKHQIRKHLSMKNLPIICDNDYGNFRLNRAFSKKYGLKRQFLHCKKMALSFHGKSYQFIAELSEDLQTVLKVLESEVD